jgi:iron complex outermembrane receptor protein
MDDAYHAVYRNPPVVLPFSIDRGGDSSRDDLEFQHILKPVDAIRVVWGTGIRKDSVRQKALYYSREEINRNVYRIFGNMEWRLARAWLANIGGSWEHDSIGGTTFAPRLNLSFQPVSGQTLRVGASRSFRTPSPYEVYGDQRLVPDTGPYFDRLFLAAPGVRPERIDSLDFGYLGDFRQYRSSLDVRVFLEQIPNRIVSAERVLTAPNCENNPLNPPGCGFADYAVNAQRVTIHGVEYQWRWQPLDSTRLMLNQAFVQVSQSQQPFATSDSSAAATIERQTTASVPNRSASAMLMQKLPYGMEFSATHHWVGEMRWTSNSIVPAYRRLDLRLAYPFRFNATGGEVAFVSQTANGEHAEFKETRIVKERHWLSVRLDF